MLIASWITVVHAHKPSDSYLSLTVPAEGQTLQGQWDIALRDLEHAVGVDVDGDTAITWAEVKSRSDVISAYAFSHLNIDAASASGIMRCRITFDELLADRHVDGGYAVFRFRASCPVRPASVKVDYSL